MVEETQQPGEESATEAKPKETRLEMRLPVNVHIHIKILSDYAAREGLIPEDHRGNVTGFLNWCITVGEAILKEHALKRRGFE